MTTLIRALEQASRPDQVLENESMAKHTSFRVGGPARLMYLPETEEQLVLAVNACKNEGLPLTVIGGGNNLLVLDGGIPGLTIRLGEGFAGCAIEGETLIARAGETLARAARAALEGALTGMEFASGIPGSIGGGMAMNAGAYGGQMADIAISCRALNMRTGAVEERPAESLDMGYRDSAVLRAGDIVTLARLKLNKGDAAEIARRMDELNERRREKQPLNLPSAGSTFKRPPGHYAGALIEGAGLMGEREGGCMVSDKHAGFIVNAGGATAADILKLIARVQARVMDVYGVALEPEVRVLGADE